MLPTPHSSFSHQLPQHQCASVHPFPIQHSARSLPCIARPWPHTSRLTSHLSHPSATPPRPSVSPRPLVPSLPISCAYYANAQCPIVAHAGQPPLCQHTLALRPSASLVVPCVSQRAAFTSLLQHTATLALMCTMPKSCPYAAPLIIILFAPPSKPPPISPLKPIGDRRSFVPAVRAACWSRLNYQ